MATSVAMYRALRTAARPPQMARRARSVAACFVLPPFVHAHQSNIQGLSAERREVMSIEINRVKLGTILAVQGRFAEAADVLKAAAKVDPADGRISLRLGQVLAAQGKVGEALHYFREATRLRHEDSEAHESLGRALAELGRKDEAAAHLREALRILRSTPAAR